MNENEEIKEIEVEDIFDRILFSEPIFDIDDDVIIEDFDLVEDTNIEENMFLKNKKFKFDEENAQTTTIII
jgi:hypothetical protein